MHSSQVIAFKLNKMGLPAAPHQVNTATDLTGQYLKDIYGTMKVKIAGSKGLQASIEQAGHRLLSSDAKETADVVIVGRDKFHYEKLQWIAEEEFRGAKVIGTNPDMYQLGNRGERVPEQVL